MGALTHQVFHQFLGNFAGISDRSDLWLKEGLGVFFAWYLEVIEDIKGQYGASSVLDGRYTVENVGYYLQARAGAVPSILGTSTYNTEAAAAMFWTLIVGGGLVGPDLYTPMNGANFTERFDNFMLGLKLFLETYPHTSASIDEFIESVAIGSGSPFAPLRLFVYEYLSYGRTDGTTADNLVLPANYIIDLDGSSELLPFPFGPAPPTASNPAFPIPPPWGVDLTDPSGCRNLA